MTRHSLSGALAGMLTGSVLLAGCAAVPRLGVAPMPRATADYAAARTMARLPETGAWPAADWWRAYGDPQLTALIEEGLKGAPDVAAAAARLRAAQGDRQQAGAA
ncbi:MAG TPA: multidrug transporter, partial [Sphingomonas sp.]